MFFFILRNFKKNWTRFIWVTALSSFPSLSAPCFKTRCTTPGGQLQERGRGERGQTCGPHVPQSQLLGLVCYLVSEAAGSQPH